MGVGVLILLLFCVCCVVSSFGAGSYAYLYMGPAAEIDPTSEEILAALGPVPGVKAQTVKLVNAQGELVTDADVITEPTLIYFGYTFCPDVCPLDTARNAEVVDLLAERGISTTPVFISIDPERDTPEAVGDFAYNMHEKMIGLTGSVEQVKAASKAYRTYFKANKAEDDEYYLVDHSTFSYLVLPEYGFVEFFRREATAAQMADTVACFVNQT